MRFTIIIFIFWYFSSCKIRPENSQISPTTTSSENYAIVEMAYKANLMQFPGVYARKYIIAKLGKEDIIKVTGFEKGYYRVNFQGKVGFISEEYFRSNPFFEAWKTNYFTSAK